MLTVHVLGSGSGLPTSRRDTTSLLIRTMDGDTLVDCPGGIVHKLARAGVSPGGLRRVILTHAHVDHVYGLPHLIHAQAVAGVGAVLRIHAPRETLELVRGLVALHGLEGSTYPAVELVPIPLEPGYTYDHSRMFIEAVARVIVRDLPDIATVERLPNQREGKVYLDFLQNRRSQTIVPPYSVRPVRGAQVSTPLFWDELEDSDLSPGNFTIHTVPPRVQERGDLFRAALEDRQDLMAAISALEEVLRGG